MQSFEKAPTYNFIVGRSVKCRVLERINFGSYGLIHKGVLLEDGKSVVVKLEKQQTGNEQVLREANMIRQLANGPGIAKIYWYGLFDPFYNVLVMEELGQSLQQLFSYCDHKFSLDTVVMLACQILDILKFIHHSNIVHRDIKPDNFLMGIKNNKEKVYIIDFGLSTTFERSRSLHRTSSISFQRSLVGTSRYASLHAHRGLAPLPRDDLESLGYCLVYFLKGSLPWQHLKLDSNLEKRWEGKGGEDRRVEDSLQIEEGQVSRDDHNHAIQKLKSSITLEDLCEGISPSIIGYLDFTRLLKPQEVISYDSLKRKFASLSTTALKVDNNDHIGQFDWTIKHRKTGEPISPKGDRGHDNQSDIIE